MALNDIGVERLEKGLAVIRLEGEHDLTTAPELRTQIGECQDEGGVVLDLSASTFIDSSILAVLVDAHRTAAENGGRFAIQIGEHPGQGVHRILEITGVNEQLEVHTRMADAVAAVRGPG
jgi:anti-sigma B factor antagonist